ncbi:MAG: triosephosphate isomerase [Candidatus Yanofskybacteria bacterium]|nr:triosephosphate isomerase [Candidatus Yanofskybacteria bacterium]
MQNKIIIANWKANPTTLDEAMEIFDFCLGEISKYQNIQLIICPPSVYLEELSKKLIADNRQLAIGLGVQDIFWEKSGPYTGEVSIDMLKEFNISHALVGHSDRRYKIGESDEIINRKAKAALAADITPVLLVGEKNCGDDLAAVLEQQLSAGLAGLTAEQVTKILIAYEPVWAISTTPGAESDTPDNILKAIGLISNYLISGYDFRTGQMPGFLYGGSINDKNIVDFLKHQEISGAVIGGASLRKEEFAEILEKVSNLL